VEREATAAPYHDWNQRIEQECYRAVVAARVLGADGRIAEIRNTLAWISFDVGPTLCEWLEREARPTYEAMLEADRLSRARLGGHGNAVAMPYHHVILPLASRRDKVTEVRWGVADFRRRFGRDPVGMWLPETAVDHETLDVLAAEGMRFTVLAPHQVANAPADGSAGLCRTSGGRSIAVFVYDGPISHDVAFGGLLKDARVWAERLTEWAPAAPRRRGSRPWRRTARPTATITASAKWRWRPCWISWDAAPARGWRISRHSSSATRRGSR
jgi:alpha-amylase/alpha-mannosidase (GH57 family)